MAKWDGFEGFLDRVSGRSKKRLMDQILERDKVILERESTNREREQTVLERESTNREREQTIHEREQTVLERENQIRRLQELVECTQDDFNVQLDRLRRMEARLRSRPTNATTRNAIANGISEIEANAVDFDAESELRRWNEIVKQFEGLELRGAQRFISPYILERQIYGRLVRAIIATDEGRRWYDNMQLIEAHEAQTLGMIGPGDTVLDCGCNQGFNSVIYSQITGPSGRVVAFDPYPINIAISKFNAEINNRTNIEFVAAGLSSSDAEVQVSTLEQCVSLKDDKAPDLATIKLVPLDRYANLRPTYLKIDIEGAEVDALSGGREIISQKPYIYLEVHTNFLPRFNREAKEIFQYISLDDYQCFLNYPGNPPLSVYEMEFEINENCAMYLVPREKPPMRRYYGIDT